MKLRFAVIGVLALSLGCSHNNKSSHAEEAEEGNEVKLSLGDVPAPVRATLTREAGDAKIGAVDREQSNGKTIYETDVMSGGKNWEIKVDADGNLISKKVEEDK
jgi:uncharacterized membrane protein YkoI